MAPTLQPCGQPNHFAASGRVKFAQISLEDGLIDRVASGLRGGTSTAKNLRTALPFTTDLELTARTSSYLHPALSETVSGLEMEARAILLVERPLGFYHGFRPRSVNHSGLAAWQVKRIVDIFNAQLDREPLLTSLTSEVGLSPFKFARAFKLATGVPPHRYLVQLRLEKARELPEGTSLSIFEFAAKVGYDYPTYLAHLFRREVGVTPAAYRRERRL